MELEDNPYIKPENYFEQYNKNIKEALNNNPHVIEWDRLCFELFERNEQGRRFIEIVKERYLIPSCTRIGTPTYQVDVIWWEGFKEFARNIINSISSHQQKILAGK